MKIPEATYERNQKFLKETYKWINVNFNMNTEADLLEFAKQRAKVNGVSLAKYIKALIQQDRKTV